MTARASHRIAAAPGGNPLVALYAFIWRPVMLLCYLWFLTLFTSMPLWMLSEDMEPVARMWTEGIASRELLRVIWRETMLVPLGVGVAVGIATGWLRSRPFAWTLPALRRRLVFGSIPLVAVLSVAMGAMHWRAGGPSVASAAFGLAALSFAIGTLVVSPMTGWRIRVVLVASMAAALVEAGAVAETAANAPIQVAAVTLVLSAALLYVTASRTPADGADRAEGRRHAYGRVFGFLSFGAAEKAPQSVPLQDAGLLAWSRAAFYSAQRSLLQVVIGFAIWLAFVYLAAFNQSDTLMLIVCLMQGGSSVGQPSGMFPYPLTRLRRAQLAFTASLATLAGSVVVVAIAVFMLAMRPRTPELLVFTLAWSPLAQWASVRLPLRDTVATYRDTASVAWRIGGMILCFGMGAFSTMLYRQASLNLSLGQKMVGSVVLAAVIQAGYWMAIRRAYLKGDLW